MNLTTPSWKCFQGKAGQAAASQLRHLTLPINGRNGSLVPLEHVTAAEELFHDRLFALQEAMVKGCQETGDLEMIKSSSTAFLARDMARLLDALGEEKLNYFGFSYGTAVGQIFAAMFPDRVGRIVLDGNDDAHGWNSQWEKGALASLEDTNVGRMWMSRREFADTQRPPTESLCWVPTKLRAQSWRMFSRCEAL